MKAWKPPQKNKNQNNKTNIKKTTIKKKNNHSLNQPTALIIQNQPTEAKTSLIKKIGKIFIALLPIIIVLGLLYTVLFVVFPDVFGKIGDLGDKINELGAKIGTKTKETCYYVYNTTKEFAKNVLGLPETLAKIFGLVVPPVTLIGIGLLCCMIPVVGKFIGIPLIAMGGMHFLVNFFSPQDKTPPSNQIPPTEVKRIEKETETTKKLNPTERS